MKVTIEHRGPVQNYSRKYLIPHDFYANSGGSLYSRTSVLKSFIQSNCMGASAYSTLASGGGDCVTGAVRNLRADWYSLRSGFKHSAQKVNILGHHIIALPQFVDFTHCMHHSRVITPPEFASNFRQ